MRAFGSLGAGVLEDSIVLGVEVMKSIYATMVEHTPKPYSDYITYPLYRTLLVCFDWWRGQLDNKPHRDNACHWFRISGFGLLRQTRWGQREFLGNDASPQVKAAFRPYPQYPFGSDVLHISAPHAPEQKSRGVVAWEQRFWHA